MLVHFLFISYVCNKTHVWYIKVQGLKNILHLFFKFFGPLPPTKMPEDVHNPTVLLN